MEDMEGNMEDICRDINLYIVKYRGYVKGIWGVHGDI